MNFFITLIILFIIAIPFGIYEIIMLQKKDKECPIEIIGGKIKNSNTDDDIKKAVKYLKIVNKN